MIAEGYDNCLCHCEDSEFGGENCDLLEPPGGWPTGGDGEDGSCHPLCDDTGCEGFENASACNG